MLLAGDVGGTKTLLGLFARAPLRPAPVAVESFPTLSYDGIVPMIREFLNKQPGGAPRVEGACFGVAGPVMADSAWMTNVPWQVDGKAVALALGLGRVHLLNDLVSIAHSVSVLQPGEMLQVHYRWFPCPNPGGTPVLPPAIHIGTADELPGSDHVVNLMLACTF